MEDVEGGLKNFSSHCIHQPYACQVCIENCLASKIDKNEMDKLKCLFCFEEIEYDDMKKFMK